MYISIPEFFPKHTAPPTWHFFSDKREALQHCDLKERNIFYSDDQNIFLIYTRSLSVVPAHSSWNPWNFLRWEQYMCLCYVNKAAFGKPSGHLRMQAGCLEKQSCAERVRTLSPNPTLPTQLLRRGEALVGAWVQLPTASDLTNLSYVMKPPQKPRMGSRETPGWWPHGAAGGWSRVGLEAPHPCPGLAPAFLPSFRVIAFYNALVTFGNLALQVKWRRKWQLTPVLLPGKFHGWRNLGSQRVGHDWATSLSLSFPFLW